MTLTEITDTYINLIDNVQKVNIYHSNWNDMTSMKHSFRVVQCL